MESQVSIRNFKKLQVHHSPQLSLFQTSTFLLPNELSRAISPSCLNNIPINPISPKMYNLRNYKTVRKTYLNNYSSHSEFLESEIIGKKKPNSHFSLIHKLPKIADQPDSYKADFILDNWTKSKVSAEIANQGFMKKGTKIGKEQCVLLFKSMHIILHNIDIKKKYKDLFIPFGLLPNLVYLKNTDFLQAVLQIIEFDTEKNEFTLKNNKEFTNKPEFSIKNYLNIKTRVIYLFTENSQKILRIKYFYFLKLQ